MNSITEDNFNVRLIDLKNEKKDSVRVGIVQLKLDKSFFKEKNGLFYPNNDYSIKLKYSKFLDYAKEYKVNILCFPELSSSEQFSNELIDYANENNIIIIGGTFYSNERKNVCPIIIPNSKKIYYNEKISISPLEKSIHNNLGVLEGKENYIIKNSPFGSFAVLICSEYLDRNLKNKILNEDIDFLFVISLNRDWLGFHTDMNRDCINNERGIYIIYSNSLLKIDGTEYSNGKSAIFGIIDNIYLDKKESPQYKIVEIYDEDIIIADFNTIQKKALLPRNSATEPNIKIIHPKSVEKERDILRFLNIIGLKEQRYKRIEELYVPPTEFSKIYDKLINNKLIFLVGDPEIGKTYTSFKLLFDSYKAGYEPVYYNENDSNTHFNMNQKLENVIEDKKTIYFEDPWGKTIFKSSDYSLRDIGSLLDKIENIDTRVIITSRRKVFKQLIDRRETAEDLSKYEFDLEINGAYHFDDLKKMLDNYLMIFKPKWHNNPELVILVKNAISEGKLKTPMNVKKLIDKSLNVDDKKTLDNIIDVAEEQTKITFGKEIESIFENDEHEKIVFLSFPYISSFFDLDFIKENFDIFIKFLSDEYGFSRIRSKDFDSLLKIFSEEKEVEVYSKDNTELLKYSHSSYSDGFSCALKNVELFRKIFYNLILRLASNDSENVRRSIATVVFEKFDRFPEIPDDLLMRLSKDDDTNIKLIIGELIFEKFNKFPEQSEEIIRILSEDEKIEVKNLVCDIISQNFENLSEFRETILKKFSDDKEPYIRRTVCDIISENFEEFSKVHGDLLLKLSEDKDENVKISVVDFFFEKFEKFKEVPIKLFLKLYEDVDIRKKLFNSIQNLVKDFNLAEKLLVNLSEYEDTKIIVGKIFSIILNKDLKNAESVLSNLLEIEESDVKMLVCDIISENYKNLSEFKEEALYSLSLDDDPNVRFYAKEITNKYNGFDRIPKEFMLNPSGDEDIWDPEEVDLLFKLGFYNQ